VIAREAPGSAGWAKWVLPICPIVAAFKFTARYSAQAREAAQRRARPAARGTSDIDARRHGRTAIIEYPSELFADPRLAAGTAKHPGRIAAVTTAPRSSTQALPGR
jgi:hypothetical protein